jgi:hypothetical protein
MLLPLAGDQFSACTTAPFSHTHLRDRKATGLSLGLLVCCPSLKDVTAKRLQLEHA